MHPTVLLVVLSHTDDESLSNREGLPVSITHGTPIYSSVNTGRDQIIGNIGDTLC